MVEDGQYSNARAWLNGLNRSIEEVQDFYTIQNINLSYLENMNTYTLSSSDRNVLYNLGSKTIPLNGYARSLYFHLTGERIPINLNYGDSGLNPRSKSKEDKWNVKAYPNPISSGIYNIEISNGKPNSTFNVTITDVSGRVVHGINNSDFNKLSIDINNWENGLYMYKVEDTLTKEIIVNKFIKL